MGDPYDDTESSITSVSQIGRRRPGQRLPQLSRVQQHLRYDTVVNLNLVTDITSRTRESINQDNKEKKMVAYCIVAFYFSSLYTVQFS
jgi:hypothetical protein